MAQSSWRGQQLRYVRCKRQRPHHSDHPVAHDGVVDGQAQGVGQQEAVHLLQWLAGNARGMDIGLTLRMVSDNVHVHIRSRPPRTLKTMMPSPRKALVTSVVERPVSAAGGGHSERSMTHLATHAAVRARPRPWAR